MGINNDACPPAPVVPAPETLVEPPPDAGEGEGGANNLGCGPEPEGPKGVLVPRTSAPVKAGIPIPIGELKNTFPSMGVGIPFRFPPAPTPASESCPVNEVGGGVCAPSTRILVGISPVRVLGSPTFSGSPPGSPLVIDTVDEKLPPPARAALQRGREQHSTCSVHIPGRRIGISHAHWPCGRWAVGK